MTDEQIKLEGAPPSPQPPTSQTPPVSEGAPVVSDLRTEYVASSDWNPYLLAGRALPQAIDDVEHDFGLQIYDRMDNDAVLNGIKRLIVTKVLEDGITVEAAVAAPPEYEDEPDPEILAEHEKAESYARFIRANLDRLESENPQIPGIEIALEEMLGTRISHGHALAEIVTEIVTDPGAEFAGREMLARLATKPRQNYAFVLSRFNEFLGIMAVVPGVSPMIRSGIVWDPANIPNVVAPEKIFLLTGGGKNGDPRGRSMYRLAYDPWFRAQQGKRATVEALVQFGGGIITVTVDKDAPKVTQSGKDAVLEAASVTKGLRSGGFGVYPHGFLPALHVGEADPKFFQWYFRQIWEEYAMAIVIEARSVLEAEHGSKNDTDKAESTIDSVRDWFRLYVCKVLKNQLFRTLMRVNFGEEIAAKYTPSAVMGEVRSDDVPTLVTALATAGYELTDRQQMWADAKIGAPVRTREEIAAMRQQQQQQEQQRQEAAPKQTNDKPDDGPKVRYKRGMRARG